MTRPALDDRPWRPIDRVGTGLTLLAFWGLVAFLLVTFLTACDNGPRPGDRCSHIGDVYAHGNVRMTCSRDHVWAK